MMEEGEPDRFGPARAHFSQADTQFRIRRAQGESTHLAQRLIVESRVTDLVRLPLRPVEFLVYINNIELLVHP